MNRAVAGCVLLLGVSACGGTPPPPFKAVVDNKVLMQAVVDVQADIIWEAVKTIDTPKGIEEVRPKNDEEWLAIKNAAVALAETGNLLMMVPRAKDGGEWMKAAQKLTEQGEAAMRAAESKDPARLFTVGGDIYEACSNCHRQYIDAIVNANK